MKRLLRFVRNRRRLSAVAGASIVAMSTAVWLRVGPLPAGLLDEPRLPSTVVVDRQGTVLYEARSDEGTRGVRLTASDIPDVLAAAAVAAEDHRFWSHVGVDPVGIARAAKRNLAERRIVEGGSTITQQVAKLLLNRQTPGRRRGWRAKIHEAVIALRLEHRFPKRGILAMYLNLASYGNQITGAERASRAYFDRPSSLLTPAQAAFIAGLPQRPSSFNPYRHQEIAMRRQRAVLRRMESAGLLSTEEARRARAERLALARPTTPFVAPHFVEMVLASTGADRPARIETTLDAGLQEDVAGVIRSHRAILERHGAANVAVVVLDNRRGAWLAWEGSGDFADAARGGAINGPVTPRQPGSALKPFTYALAFEEGYTPATVLPDVPMHFPTAEDGILYSPRNYDGRYRGPLLVRRALAGSENVPAVALASDLGVPKLLRFLTRAGLSTFDKTAAHYGLGLTLGNAEVRLDELVAAYAAFARGGEWLAPASTIAVRDGARDTVRLVSPRTAFWITDILSDPEAREYIFGRGGSLELPFPAAVKTGTSQAYHDNWTVGYTRDLTVGVWVGNFDRTPLRNSSGVTGAAPIFQAVMLAAQKRFGTDADAAPVANDGTSQRADVCALSGMSPNAWCPTTRREWLPAGDRPLPCSWHHLSDEGLLVVWPKEFRQWARAAGSRGAGTLSRGPDAETSRTARPGAEVSGASTGSVPATLSALSRPNAALTIASPPDGATYLIDPTLRREFQTVPLRATTDAVGPISWSVNGRIVGEAARDAAVLWPLTPGTHHITARDSRGQGARAAITVR